MHHAKIVEKKKIDFLLSPYCTFLFSGKEMIKFFEVALIYVHDHCPISYVVFVRGNQPWNTVNTIADICLLVENDNKNTDTKCKVCSNFFY